MKPNLLNRCLKPLIWLWVLAIIVMLILPLELTDAQQAQIKPGMTIAEVHRRLGKSNIGPDAMTMSIYSGPPGQLYATSWWQPEKWCLPVVAASLPYKAINMDSQNQTSKWLGKSSLRWVKHDNDKVLKVWLIPVTMEDGGLQGCINTFREHWNDWWK